VEKEFFRFCAEKKLWKKSFFRKKYYGKKAFSDKKIVKNELFLLTTPTIRNFYFFPMREKDGIFIDNLKKLFFHNIVAEWETH